MTNAKPTPAATLRETVAFILADCGNRIPGSMERTDTYILPGPRHYMEADAAIAAVRRYLTSPEAIDRAVKAEIALQAFPSEGPYFFDRDRIRKVLLAALGDG